MTSPLHHANMLLRMRELREAAERSQRATHRHRNPEASIPATAQPVTLRRATAGDADPLRRLAELEGRSLAGSELLVAEVEGELLAAVAIEDGAAIADPFRRTAELVDLLRFRATALRGATGARRRRALRLPRVLRRRAA